MEIPEDLKKDGAGAALWTWLCGECTELAACAPLALELCLVCERLHEIRSKIASQGLLVSGVRGRSAKNPLIDLELKASKQFQLLWRSLGLADRNAETPDGPRRPVGRPPAGGDLWRG